MYCTGIVRPLVMTRPPPVTPSKGQENATDAAETPLAEVAPTTPECPTVPPYVAIATQQLNNTLKAVDTNNGRDNTTVVAGDPWTYPAMVGLIASIGASLLFLNLMVIGCFCYMRHRTRRQLPHLDSTGSTVTTTLAAKYDMTEVEKAAALKQLLVEVNKTDRPFGRQAACGGSAESVSSVIDLTGTHAPTCHSLCPSEYQVIQSASNDSPHFHFRPTVSLTDLQNHTTVLAGLNDQHQTAAHRPSQDFNARRVRMGHDRNASFHEITV